MINFNKTSGFITLTIVLIIVLLVTAITLMTGKMLLGEQRSGSNQMRYQEAANAAQFGLDKAIAQLMNNFDNQVDFEIYLAFRITMLNLVIWKKYLSVQMLCRL